MTNAAESQESAVKTSNRVSCRGVLVPLLSFEDDNASVFPFSIQEVVFHLQKEKANQISLTGLY